MNERGRFAPSPRASCTWETRARLCSPGYGPGKAAAIRDPHRGHRQLRASVPGWRSSSWRSSPGSASTGRSPVFQSQRTGSTRMRCESSVTMCMNVFARARRSRRRGARTATRARDTGHLRELDRAQRAEREDALAVAAPAGPTRSACLPREIARQISPIRYRQRSATSCCAVGDGIFAYQLAVVVDDGAMGSRKCSGSRPLASTARQILLHRLLDSASLAGRTSRW